MIDGFFVSNYAGKMAFAAVNLIWPFLQLISAAGFMFGSGGSALTAFVLGTGDEKKANEIFTMLVMVLGVILSLIHILRRPKPLFFNPNKAGAPNTPDAPASFSPDSLSDFRNHYAFLPQHFLYFLPLPHGHGSLGKIFFSLRIVPEAFCCL